MLKFEVSLKCLPLTVRLGDVVEFEKRLPVPLLI